MTTIEELRAMVLELADELETEIRSRYGYATMGPLVERRLNRDMKPVLRARKLLKLTEGA